MKIPPFRKNKPFLFFIIPGLLVLFIILLISSQPFVSIPPEKPQIPEPPRAPEPAPPPPDMVVTGQIKKGQTLSTALRAQGLPADLVEAISRQLNPAVNLRQIKPDDRFEVRSTPEGKFLSFTFQASPLDIYQISVDPSGRWGTQKKEILIDKYWVRVSGEIASSLFEAMNAQGEQDQLVLDFVDIFAWEIDFHSDPQKGDCFELVVEKYFVDGNFVRYGRILWATYQSASRKSQGIYDQPPGESGGYYNWQGESLRKAFLRSPLKFTRISSGYSKSRRHPILGGQRPHYGIDYAAPSGTPVVAIGDGIVTACGWNGGYGNQVILRHANGYESMYGHLSRFGRGIAKGKRVRQKQVIGYVGSTGISTGPHLDFRLLRNKAFVNPLRVVQPPAAPLRPEQMPAFKDTLTAALGAGPNGYKVAESGFPDLGRTGEAKGPTAIGNFVFHRSSGLL